MMKSKKAIIFGIKGTKLSISEISLLKNFNPWGIILFDRNIKNIYQVKKLTNQIRSVTKNKKYPISIYAITYFALFAPLYMNQSFLVIS